MNGTVSQNTLPGVVRISCVVEPIFRKYHQTMSFLRSDSVRSSSKSLKPFPCRSDFSWGKMARDPVKTGHVVSYRISFYIPLQFLLPRISCVVCIPNYPVHVYELKCVHGHHIRRHTELDGTSDVFRWRNVAHFFQFLITTFAQFLTFQTSNNRQKNIILRNVGISLL